MSSMLKSALLSVGLLAGTALAAQAQSVSSLPPAGSNPVVPQTAVTEPFGSNQSFYPKPGGNAVWKDPNYHPPADYATNPADHPYSTSIGPKPGSHSSGTDVPYRATAWDAQPAHHPYDATGMGPRAN
ncbi:MAG: hypothetical protein WB710_07360 [Stellaceae bacterium]